jgi:nicotinate-nucleotide pyrophosphorylase (carboxylating)
MSDGPLLPIDPSAIRAVVVAALDEDRAQHDVTTRALVPPDQRGRGVFVAKQPGVIAGLEAARATFSALSLAIEVEPIVDDGGAVEPGEPLAAVSGPLAPILSAERVALNLMQRMSGIATETREYVRRAAEGGPARVLDTRKTTPGLRDLERYAVRVGGAHNHRNTLEDGVMIKDNHIEAARQRGLDMAAIVSAARAGAAHTLQVEVEADDEKTALAAIEAGADIVLLDNMSPEEMRRIVEAAPVGVLFEASGGITLDTVREVAASGVHLISVGALTHSAPALDISLDIEPE